MLTCFSVTLTEQQIVTVIKKGDNSLLESALVGFKTDDNVPENAVHPGKPQSLFVFNRISEHKSSGVL